MERFSHRESVLLGCSPQTSFMNHPISSPKSPSINSSDVDFNDVFGGPPRRSSIHEVRHSFSDSTDSYTLKSDEETSSYRRRVYGLSEKPVFGEEGVNRRRYASDNFFDDIFKVNESLTSSPRKNDRDPFSSSPGSRVLSPVRPLSPRTEPFAGSSLPAQFSLPAKLIKGSELPTFGSSARNHHRNPLSRFSSQANQAEEEPINDVYLHSSLSLEQSLISEESLNFVKPDEMDKGNDLKMDSNRSEVPTASNQFHFSIYKWASKGIPLALPLGGGNSPKWKEKFKFERSSSASGRIASEDNSKELPTVTPKDIDFPSFNINLSSDAQSPEIELGKQENGSPHSRVEQEQTVAETILPKSKPESPSAQQEYGRKSELKTLRSLLIGMDEIAMKNEIKESKVKSIKSSAAFDVSEKLKKQDGKETMLNNVEMDKTNLKGSPTNSRDVPAKNGIRGKVKEFVKIFNQEASNKPKVNMDSQNRSSRWKERGKSKTEDYASVTSTKVNEKVHLPNMKKKNTPVDSIAVDEFFKQLEKQHSESRTNDHNYKDISFGLKGRSASAASIPGGSEAIAGDPDDSFQANILVKELPQDEDKLPQAGDNTEDIQIINAKIRKWSNGKEGNIRSLLSTLQYVLWPESGWKPVPLVDIIEGSAVKRSYQKALLSLHPDKVQQKGATSHQKYLAEKVFEILQEAWTLFNSLGSV